MSKNIKIIHIPKTGGHYLRAVMGIDSHHKNIHGMGYDDETKIIFTRRHPFDWYGSYYNFFNVKFNELSNPLRKVAKNLSFEEYLKCFLYKDKLEEYKKKISISLAPWDQNWLESNDNYGLFTYYVSYFCGKTDQTINETFNWIKKRSHIFSMDILSNDLKTFCEKYNISYNKDLINQRINKSSDTGKYGDWYTKEMKEMVYKQDKLYFEYFYPYDIEYQISNL